MNEASPQNRNWDSRERAISGDPSLGRPWKPQSSPRTLGGFPRENRYPAVTRADYAVQSGRAREEFLALAPDLFRGATEGDTNNANIRVG